MSSPSTVCLPDSLHFDGFCLFACFLCCKRLYRSAKKKQFGRGTATDKTVYYHESLLKLLDSDPWVNNVEFLDIKKKKSREAWNHGQSTDAFDFQSDLKRTPTRALHQELQSRTSAVCLSLYTAAVVVEL